MATALANERFQKVLADLEEFENGLEVKEITGRRLFFRAEIRKHRSVDPLWFQLADAAESWGALSYKQKAKWDNLANIRRGI